VNYVAPFNPLDYYLPEHLRLLREAQTFEDVASVAVSVLDSMPHGIHVISGPISSGGYGIEQNLRKFNAAINALAVRGITVFSQMPLEDPIRRIRCDPRYSSPLRLLRAIYLRIFGHRKVTSICFLPEYRESFGATWEHELAVLLESELERLYVVPNFEDTSIGYSIFLNKS
jgi:hypothetical protein